MECHCLRSSQLPHATKLYSAFLEHFDQVAKFYAHPPTLDGIEQAARQVSLPSETRRAVVAILREQSARFGADPATERSFDRLADGALAVVTGQQVGLFSGPAFSFYKALTAIRLARDLTARGTDAVPIFWLATEDHDLEEINHSLWLNRNGSLGRVEIPARAADSGHRVGEILLGDAVVSSLETTVALLEGPSTEHIRTALADSYRPGETYGSAFGRLMARLLAGRGVILLDPLDPRLHRLAAPVYRRAVEEAEALSDDLLGRGKTLDRAGYHVQVKVTQRSTLLFLNVDGHRLPLRRRNAAFLAGEDSLSRDELLRTLDGAPEGFSANVLLRPVVQDTLLPTAAYVAGPAEVAYFAQAEVVYRRLLGRMPAVVPRAGFTLVEPRLARLLKQYGLAPADLFRGRQHVRARMERAGLPRGLARRFSAGEKEITALLAKLRTPLGKLDKTLLGALDTASRKMLYQYLKLQAKAGRAEGLRTGLLDAHERLLLDSLYPHRALQERSHCLLPYLARHGLALLDELERRAAIGDVHQVLFL